MAEEFERAVGLLLASQTQYQTGTAVLNPEDLEATIAHKFTSLVDTYGSSNRKVILLAQEELPKMVDDFRDKGFQPELFSVRCPSVVANFPRQNVEIDLYRQSYRDRDPKTEAPLPPAVILQIEYIHSSPGLPDYLHETRFSRIREDKIQLSGNDHREQEAPSFSHFPNHSQFLMQLQVLYPFLDTLYQTFCPKVLSAKHRQSGLLQVISERVLR